MTLPIGVCAVRGDVPTNEVALEYWAPKSSLERTEPAEGLFERFLHEVTTSDSIVFDRLSGPSSELRWMRKENQMGYESLERFNERGASLFGTIAVDSLRTAAMGALPLESWQNYWEERLASLLTGAIGNPEEEHIQVKSITYSAVRSSWERQNENVGLRWGIRPWRTSPYLYFLAHAGRWEGRRLFTLEGRVGYTLFGSARVEGRLTLQLPGSFRLAGSGAMDLTQMVSGDAEPARCSIMLERTLSSRSDAEGVFFIGFRSGMNHESSHARQESLVIAGLSRRW